MSSCRSPALEYSPHTNTADPETTERNYLGNFGLSDLLIKYFAAAVTRQYVISSSIIPVSSISGSSTKVLANVE